jgi:hypothetical protein
LRTTSNGNLFTSLKEIATLTPKKADQMQCSMPNEHAKLMAMELLDMLGDQAPTEPREVCVVCVCIRKRRIYPTINDYNDYTFGSFFSFSFFRNVYKYAFLLPSDTLILQMYLFSLFFFFQQQQQ